MKMSNFEVYAEKLQVNSNRLMALIQSPRFFGGGYIALPDEIVVHDEQEAIAYATDQNIDLNKGSEYQYWTGIQEMNNRGNAAHEKTKRLRLGIDFDLLADNISKGITNAISKKGENEKISSPLIDVTCADFYLFLLNMTLFERQSKFHRSLYHAFENGGIPCGWKGEFPKGSLLVYSRKSMTVELDQELDNKLLSVINNANGAVDARSVLLEYKDRGFSAQEVYALLESIRSSIVDEDIEDKVLEIMDVVVGFCHPNFRVWHD
jgi:hypothetical protein